ncbi:MAG: M1 family peptidase, partial [Bacteroidetes bacterium]|nr:M1 family peptidase [Bacteroidota bacterium]
MNILSLLFLILYVNTIIFAQFGSQDTGGPLSPEQAAYDVKYYNINLEIDPVEKSIAGWVGINAQVIKSISFFVLDLDDRYDIALIKLLSAAGEIFMLPFQHNNGQIIIELPYVFNPCELIDIEIHYKGIPRVAERPPWDDGFTWSKTESGEDWIGVTCQGGGADIWWPCKDHPSDEPDSASLSFTVPGNLFCASNGKLLNTIDNLDGTKTFEWFVSTP